MTNTIPNVPRELLEVIEQTWRIHYKGGPVTTDIAADAIEKGLGQLRALLSVPSPAGVDGLEVVATLLIDDPTDQECGDWDIDVESKVAERMSEHGGGQHELCRLSDAQAIIEGLRGENEALHAQVKVLQSDANSWQSGYDEGRRMGGKHCALTIDQQAQRIGELEGLLRHAQKQVPTGSGLHMRIDTALSAGKEGSDEYVP